MAPRHDDGNHRPSPRGGAPHRSATRGWLQLGGGIAAIVVFIYVLAPLGQRWEPWGRLGRFIAERDIDANAYYYTEVEEFAQAENALRNKMTYQEEGFTAEKGF